MTEEKLFRYTLTVTLPSGEKKRLYYSATTKKEAKRKRDQARYEYGQGLLTFSADMPLRDYGEAFIIQQKLSADDSSRLRRYCLDIIGYLKIKDVKAPNIRACFGLLEGKSRSMVGKTCGVINRMFETAVADDILTKNPCRMVPRPKTTLTHSRRAMTEAEEKFFRETLAKRINDGKHAGDIAFGIMYACGLRPGEVRGLQRSDIKLTPEPTLRVVRAAKDKSRTIGMPKTDSGIREVPIPEWFVPLLQASLSKDSLFVTPAEDGGVLPHETLIRRWKHFYNAMKIYAGATTYRNQIILSPIGDDLDPYSLRHTYCTNLAYAGIPEVVAMRWMGHSDPTMIQKVYADASNEKLLRKARQTLNSVEI